MVFTAPQSQFWFVNSSSHFPAGAEILSWVEVCHITTLLFLVISPASHRWYSQTTPGSAGSGPTASAWTTIKQIKCVKAHYMAALCSQSHQSFLRVFAVGWGLRQSQSRRARREQNQKEIEPARIQVGGVRGTLSNAENRYICHHGLLDWSQTYRGCTVSGGLMIDMDMLV